MIRRIWRALRQQDRVEELGAAVKELDDELFTVAAREAKQGIRIEKLEREHDELLQYRDWACVFCDAPSPLPPDHWRTCPNHPAREVVERQKQALAALVEYVERETCTHEETYRGGMIWEICHTCGAKWADDEGGKPEFEWPEAVTRARAILGEEEEV